MHPTRRQESLTFHLKGLIRSCGTLRRHLICRGQTCIRKSHRRFGAHIPGGSNLSCSFLTSHLFTIELLERTPRLVLSIPNDMVRDVRQITCCKPRGGRERNLRNKILGSKHIINERSYSM